MQRRFEHDANHFRFAIGVRSKVCYTATTLTLRQIILFVTRHTGDVEALHVIVTASSVAVDDVIDGASIVLLEDINMDDIGSDKNLLRHANNLVLAVTMEDDDIVQVGTIAQELILLQSGTDKAFLAVDIELLVGLNHGLDVDIGEVTHLRSTRIFISVFSLERFEPANRIIGQVAQVFLGLFDFLIEVLHQLVGFFGVELRDTNHADVEEFLDILAFHIANEFGFERFEGFVHESNQFLFIGRCFVAFLLIDTILDKDTLQ